MLFAVTPTDSGSWLGVAAAVAITILALLALMSPALMVSVALAVYPTVNAILVSRDVGIGGINLSQVLVVGLAGLTLLGGVLATSRHGVLRVPRGVLSFLVPMLSLGAWAMASLSWSSNPRGGLAPAARMLMVPVLILGLTLVARSLRELRLMAWGMATGAALTGVLAALEKVALKAETIAIIKRGAIRASGGLTEPVSAGTLCMGGAFIAVYLLVTSAGRQRVLAAGMIGAALAGIVSTFTRTALLGTAVFIMVLTIREFWRPETRKKAIMIAGVALLVGAASLGSLVSKEEIQARTSDLNVTAMSYDPHVGSSRALLWAAAIRILRHSSIAELITGHGGGSIYMLNSHYANRYLGAHNSTLQLLVDYGLVGLFLYLFTISMLFLYIRRTAYAPGNGTMHLVWSVAAGALIAYYLSTDMFNHAVCSMGPRFWGHMAMIFPALHLRLTGPRTGG